MEEREGNGHNASILKHDQLEESEMNITDLVLAWGGGRNLIKHITDVLKVQNILGWKECNTCRFFILLGQAVYEAHFRCINSLILLNSPHLHSILSILQNEETEWLYT